MQWIFNYTELHRENVEDHRVKPLGNFYVEKQACLAFYFLICGFTFSFFN
jgi:hypothetical protein